MSDTGDLSKTEAGSRIMVPLSISRRGFLKWLTALPFIAKALCTEQAEANDLIAVNGDLYYFGEMSCEQEGFGLDDFRSQVLHQEGLELIASFPSSVIAIEVVGNYLLVACKDGKCYRINNKYKVEQINTWYDKKMNVWHGYGRGKG